MHVACMTRLAAYGQTQGRGRAAAHWTGNAWEVEDQIHDVLVLLDAESTANVSGNHGNSLRDALSRGRLHRGVQRAGFPNLFVIRDADALAYTVGCLHLLDTTDAVWLDVRGSVQTYPDRRESRSVRSGFGRLRTRGRHRLGDVAPRRDDLWLGYDAPGLLDPEWCGRLQVRDANAAPYEVNARLSGSMQPTDGRYHWQGQLDFAGELRPGSDVQLRVADGAWTTGRITETTAWGLRVAGAGKPPFPLAALEIDQPAP